jgi:inhibitor of KinA
MAEHLSYRIFPLGDSAITLDFGNRIDEKLNDKIIVLYQSLTKRPLAGMIEAVPAYSSITVYYDPLKLHGIFDNSSPGEMIRKEFEKRCNESLPESPMTAALKKIPVCYDAEFGCDLEEVATAKNISIDELIRIHNAKTYRVYMLGFLPGFPYMGETDERISIPRRTKPRQKVEAGSVGIAGRQTGIYPLNSPGGWQILGRTPLKLFDSQRTELTLLNAGDSVQFYPISKDEFENYQGGTA